MGRIVRPARIVQSGAVLESLDGSPPTQPATVEEPGDTYLERVAKYVPAEIVAFFIFANSILKQSMHEAPPTMAGVSVISVGVAVLALAWLITPITIWRASKPGDAWRLNALMASLLFPVWAYAVEGVGLMKFVQYDGHLASIILGGASLVSGLFAPAPTSEPPS